MTPVLIGILIYVVAQVLIGALVTTRIKTNEDYLLAGRGLGYGLGTFTVFATWFGAESCIGSAGRAYQNGMVAGEVDPFGYSLCLVLLGVVFAVPFWSRRYLTMADLFRDRYSVGVERLAIALLIPTSLLWGAAQLRAFGQVLASASNGAMSVEVAIAIATFATLIYCVMGGMLADAITDLVQGLCLIVGLAVLFAVVVWNNGGLAIFQAVPQQRWILIESNGRPWYEIANAWAIPVMNAVASQELIARMLASKSATVARNNCLLAAGLYLGVGAMPFLLGVLGPNLVPNMADPEQILPTLAKMHLPTILFVLFSGAIVSALLSTIDSCLLVSGALVSHNLMEPLVGPMSDRAKLGWSRTWVLTLGLITYGLTYSSDTVFGLVQESSQFGASGLFVVICFGLFTRLGGSLAAAAGMLGGTGAYLVGDKVIEIPASFLISLGVGLLAYVSAALVESAVWKKVHSPSG